MAASSTDKAGTFLFVNESINLPPRRIGHSHDIRSHVRRHTARQVKTVQKKAETERKLAPRLPKDLEHSTFELMLCHRDLRYEDLPAISPHLDGTGVNLLLASKDFDELQNTDDALSRYYCKTCGAQLHSPNDLTKRVHAGQLHMAEKIARLPLALNPVELLGAGRVDPFLSYPVDNPGRYIHEMIDLGELPNDRFFRPSSLSFMQTHILQL